MIYWIADLNSSFNSWMRNSHGLHVMDAFSMDACPGIIRNSIIGGRDVLCLHEYEDMIS